MPKFKTWEDFALERGYYPLRLPELYGIVVPRYSALEELEKAEKAAGEKTDIEVIMELSEKEPETCTYLNLLVLRDNLERKLNKGE